jgi:uncharacterized protein YbjT (DUF2867 family)
VHEKEIIMILVTGAGGTVGSEVIAQLQRAGAKFRAAVHSDDKLKVAKAKGIDAVKIDFDRVETLREALRGVDKVFLLTGSVPNQVEQETNLVKTAKEAGVKHIVKLSVVGAHKERIIFSRIHRAAEKAIEASGISWTFLRANSFMQNLVNYDGETIRSQDAFYGAAGDGKISHIDVRDIAAVAVKVLTETGHAGKTYELNGPEALSYTQVAEKISKASGKKISYVDVPPDQLKQGMLEAGLPDAYAEALLDLHAFYKRNEASTRSDDIKRVTGRDPITFDQYATENAAAFRG